MTTQETADIVARLDDLHDYLGQCVRDAKAHIEALTAANAELREATIEECAKAADWYVKMWSKANSDPRYNDGAKNTAEHIASAIRALARKP